MAVTPFGRTWTCDRCHMQQFVPLFEYRFDHDSFRFEAAHKQSSDAMNSARMPNDWAEMPYNPKGEHFCPACMWVMQNEQDLVTAMKDEGGRNDEGEK